MKQESYQDLVAAALSDFSKSKNDIARLEQKFDDHVQNNDEKLTKILEAVNYTNGRMRKLEAWKIDYVAEQRGIEKGKSIVTGKEPRFTSTQVKVAVVTGVTSVIIAFIAVWDHYITKRV